MILVKFDNKFDRMKKLIIYFFIAIMASVGFSCQDVTVGYLITEYAGYSLDSLVIRTELDGSPGEPNPEFQEWLDRGYTASQIEQWFGVTERINAGADYQRVAYKIPWTSSAIEGIEGSAPILCSVKSITSSDGGEVDKLQACISVRGNGVISVPLEHHVPRGRYLISLNFSNKGWSEDVNDCFTIIVK